ncbi:MAG: hypothetical protein Tsb008_09710 [Rhodothalassiaceae bacterium]
MWHRLFQAHPASVGESYAEHLRTAISFAGLMAIGALVCMVHALIPGLFVRTGSSIVGRLHDRMIRNRRRVHDRSGAMTGFDYVI